MGADLMIQPYYDKLAHQRSMCASGDSHWSDKSDPIASGFPIGHIDPFYFRTSCWPTEGMLDLGITDEDLARCGFEWNGKLGNVAIGNLILLFCAKIDEFVNDRDFRDAVDSLSDVVTFLSLAFSLVLTCQEGSPGLEISS